MSQLTQHEKKTLQRLRQSNTTILPWPTPSTTTRSTHTLTQHWTKTGLRLPKGDAKMTRNSQAFPSLGPRLGVCCDPSHGTVTRGEHLSLSVWKMWHAPFMWKGRNTSLLQTRGSSESLFNVGKTHEWLVLCLISRWTTKGKHAHTHTHEVTKAAFRQSFARRRHSNKTRDTPSLHLS